MLLYETHVMVKQQTVSDYFENNVIKFVAPFMNQESAEIDSCIVLEH